MPRLSRYPPPSRSLRAALLAGAALSVIALPACGDGADRAGDPSRPVARFDADRAFQGLRRQVELGPRPSGSPAARRLAGRLAESLRRAGVEAVQIQRPERNVVGLIPGKEDGYLVLGAHYDTKDIPGFQGANDGASGAATVVELARSLPNPMPGPALAIALFDAEEARGDRRFAVDGMRGSRRYVELAAAPRGARRGSPPLAEIEAMVLLDMVGDCDLAIPRESHSDPELYGLFAAADPEVFAGETVAISDDHVPFLQAGIPAVNLIDFRYGPGPTPGAFWHTRRDTIERVCAASLGAVGAAVEQGLLQFHELG